MMRARQRVLPFYAMQANGSILVADRWGLVDGQIRFTYVCRVVRHTREGDEKA